LEALGDPGGRVFAVGEDAEEVAEGILRFSFLLIGIGEGFSERDVIGEEDIAAGEGAGAGDGVFELADVTGPAVVFEVVESFAAEVERWDSVAAHGHAEKVLSKQRDVFGAGAEWGEVNFHDVHPVEEVFAEAVVGDFFCEVFVGGGNDADVIK
jgi:hypothetical protein